ncbi:MAG: 16S rRNA (cytosine(1402)-N(4))-methyltransferase RsmH [Thermotogota bacterium]
MSTQAKYHISVMPSEVISNLVHNPQGTYLDATFGEGGHSLQILNSFPQAKVIGIDKDLQILKWGEERLKPYSDRLKLFRANYTDMDIVLRGMGIKKVDGILFDLGVSSYQLDYEERGFSFQKDGPLDMRMDIHSGKSAKQILNTIEQKKLEEIIREYGEEKFARSIAKRICANRPLETTGDLVQSAKEGIPVKVRSKMRKNFATRTFQAIRIFVNRELDELEDGLKKSLNILNHNGRIIVLSFHSLEDRIVKVFFREKDKEGILRIITKKPLIPSPEEVKFNRRSRSTKMRVAELI